MNAIWDIISAVVGIASSLVLLVFVWWKVSKGIEANQILISEHEEEIKTLKTAKTDNHITARLSQAVETIEKAVNTHHTDFRIHRNEDSERRMNDLILTVNALANENKSDHLTIMAKLARLEKD